MLSFYGLFISLGILVGSFTVEKFRNSLKRPILKISVFDTLIWVIVPGVIGARLYHVLDYWYYYEKNMLKIFYLWQGGLGIFGAISGGVLGILFFTKLKSKHLQEKQKFSQKFLSLLDLATIGLPLGQAIGRLGNYFNQELYGLPTNLPWGITIDKEKRPLEFEGITKFHPLFAYESLVCILIFILIYLLLKKNNNILKKPGFIFFLYLFLYSFSRFFLEFLRVEKWMISGFRVNQLVSIALCLASILFIKTQVINKKL